MQATSDGIETYYDKSTNLTSSLSYIGAFIQDNNKTFMISRTSSETMLIAFSCGIWASLNVTLGVLHFRVSLPTSFINQTLAMFGNYNGESAGDLIKDYGAVMNAENEKNVYYFAENCKTFWALHA